MRSFSPWRRIVRRSRVAAAVLTVAASGAVAVHVAAGKPAKAADVESAIVDVNTALGYDGSAAAGTGIVLSSDGIVLTNNHVIRGATTVRATDIGNGRTYKATVLGYDVGADVAVIKLANASGLATAPVASGSPKVGQAVTAIGNAGGVGGRPSSASGKITGLGRSITAGDGEGGAERLTGLIEMNAALQPGDSGGPLVDSAGRVVGMDTAASVGFEFQQAANQGYAIPIARALALAKRIQAGKASATTHIGPTAMLGVRVGAPDDGFGFGFGGGLGTEGSGALVLDVVPGSPADRAGIASGDVITGLGGKSISSPGALSSQMLRHAPKDSVALAWVDQFGSSNRATVRLAVGPPQ